VSGDPNIILVKIIVHCNLAGHREL